MAGRLVVLCPGQGGQHAAMYDLACTDPAAVALLDEWQQDGTIGPALQAARAGRDLHANRVAQPAIVAATLAMWTALGVLSTSPVLAAGYSIGELSAWGVAGALAPTLAVRLAVERASLMDACVAADAPQAMLALSGLPLDALERLLPSFGYRAAIVTADDALVAGGPAGQRDALAEAAVAAGGRATPLPVAVASHTPLLQGAVAPFQALLQRQRWDAPAFPVLSGVTAQSLYDGAGAAAALAGQIATTIRWHDCMDACAEAGATVALELGPGAALARMLNARHPHIACRSVTEFRTLDGIRAWLDRHLD